MNQTSKLIYGKDSTEGIVGCGVKDGSIFLFKHDGTVEKREHKLYSLLNRYPERGVRLAGENHFRYAKTFKSKSERSDFLRKCERKNIDTYTVWNDVESAMVKDGFTMYKGLAPKDLSVLSFDIETNGLKIDGNSFVVLISNTFRDKNGKVTRRLFAFDDYDKPADMVHHWCKWVRDMNPDIVLGHNILGYDFPFLRQFCKNYKADMHLGRDASKVKFGWNESQFRKDGSQTLGYFNVDIFGREVIDTMFMSIKHHMSNGSISYGLKNLIKHHGLERDQRTFWDFSIKDPWTNPRHWATFKEYCRDDADDGLALFDLMSPQFFYYCQSIPRGFQRINNTATGGQVNSFMVRSYLQDRHSIPKPSGRADYEGAISIGNPGVYKHVYKIDVASLYPSIIREHGMGCGDKDPNNYFGKMVEYFTLERLENKRLAAETGEQYYKDLSDGQKIMINSAYGFLGSGMNNFNQPESASAITRWGRKYLEMALEWAEKRGYAIVNADTDSISFTSGDILSMSDILSSVNSLYPDLIKWEDDGYYDSVVVVKAKNYALMTGDKIKIKGSGLKATMKEPALADFLKKSIESLLTDRGGEIPTLYNATAASVSSGTIEIDRWCSKKTVTKAVLNPKRTNEQRVLDAIGDKTVQEGDKIHVFFEESDRLALLENFNGVYCSKTLLKKLFNTVKILKSVLTLDDMPNYSLKKNQERLSDL